MTSNPQADRRAAIARMVQAGKIKHEQPGQYYDDDMTPEEKALFPEYDGKALREAFPDLLQVMIDEDRDASTNEVKRYVVVLQDGRQDDIKIDIGTKPPQSTEELLEHVRAYYRKTINLEDLEATAKEFEGF